MTTPRPLAASLAALLTLAAAPAPPDFSGTWEFNPARSSNVGMMSAMKLTATLEQTATALSVVSKSVFNQKEGTNENRFDLTGRSVPNASPMEGTSQTVSKWDGDKLVTTWTREGSVAGSTVVRVETRSLSSDGRTMTVESRRGSNAPIVMVYDRK